MSEDLDQRLRAALRPIAPSEEFAAQLVARLTHPRSVGARRFVPGWLAAGVAASLLLALGLERHLHNEQREGVEARRQVIEALRVTSQKLDLAYAAVKQPGV
jgi:hypothetical protein